MPNGLKVLLGALVLAVIALAAVGAESRGHRTAVAEAEILEADYASAPYVNVPGGHRIRYRFVAAGAVFTDVTFRTWGLDVIDDARVCDPADPTDHDLVKRSASCG